MKASFSSLPAWKTTTSTSGAERRLVDSIEPGKLADLAILSANPLEDLRSSTSVERVMVGGRLCDVATLDQIAPERIEREPFFFERDEQGRLILRPGT